MSIKLMSYVWDIPTGTPTEKLILLALADRADDEGNNVRPSKTGIASRCCLDRRTVQRVMERLEDTGVLVLVAQRIGYPTVYRLDAAKLAELSVKKHDVAPCHTPNQGVRQDATPPATTDRSPVRHETAGGCGVTPPNTPIQPSIQPSEHPPIDVVVTVDHEKGQDTVAVKTRKRKEPAPITKDFANDWPLLHVKDGDYLVKEPYASDERIKTAMIEWIYWRLCEAKKGMPTVFALTRSNCGWWDKYPIDAVREAVEKAASERWQGIIEQIARDYKPNCNNKPSTNGSIAENLGSMQATMEQRQAMIRSAGQRAAGA